MVLFDQLSQSSLEKSGKRKHLVFLHLHLVQGHQTCHPIQGCTVILHIIAGEYRVGGMTLQTKCSKMMIEKEVEMLVYLSFNLKHLVYLCTFPGFCIALPGSGLKR